MPDGEEHIDNTIAFSVDAGLIDRLGRELVGRAETAVSELIKNAYDADARNVYVNFINAQETGGTLRIEDDGMGMTLEQLKIGFMTISSTDKLHYPQSTRYHRSKAGRKGIGRFATQRLGSKLTVITQTLESTEAIKLIIEWNDYKTDTELTSVPNSFEYVEKTKSEGTTLFIEHLREWWSDSDLRRVYRYVSELLQPDYISERSEELGLATQSDDSFEVSFYQTDRGVQRVVADPQKMIFEKALAVIEGYVDKHHDGYWTIKSTSLNLDDIEQVDHEYIYDKVSGNKENKYLLLSDIHFKAYYFIYNRPEYYTSISKMELKSIRDLAEEQGGIKLYRNGFRVLPYGESNDDWLKIDKRYGSISGATNVPFGNRNLFGFVEIIDPSGELFQETASREGLIENAAYVELTNFLYKALQAARIRLAHGVTPLRKPISKPAEANVDPDTSGPEKTPIEKLEDLEKSVNEIINTGGKMSESDSESLRLNTQRIVQELKSEFQLLLDEVGMLRVLAGLGLTIGEFTHEVVQFSPSILGDLSVLSSQLLDAEGLNSLENLKRTIQVFTAYTSYFNATVSANVSRELKPQDLHKVVNQFKRVILPDVRKLGIDFQNETFGYDLLTIPMHASEWSSILFNFYTNSKKAIRRHGVPGMIRIVVGKEESNIYLEFSDNGDGIPEHNASKIFDAFFTTSSPAGFESSEDDKLVGTGLGLKIVKDIVQTYGGKVELVKPESGYVTCFRIDLPLFKDKQPD
jgi:signal transduction histidine kinase